MQALLLGAFGKSSMLGNAMASMEAEGESVKESFLQPQPVGLTNIQCKVVGPYFTNHPTHQHPEATLADLTASVYEAPSNFLAEHSVKDEGVLGHVHLCIQETEPPIDLDEREMDYLLLASALPDPEAVMEKVGTTGGGEKTDDVAGGDDSPGGDAASSGDAAAGTTGGNRIILQEALKVVDTLDEEAKERLHRLLCGCPVMLTPQPYGHQMERALSIALLGTDCHWNVVNQELLKCFDSEEALSGASRNLGLDPKALAKFRPYLSTGLPVPQEATTCMWYFAAQFLRRTIVVYQGPAAHATMAFAPDVEDPSTVCRRPLLIYDEGTGRPKSAVVPVQPLSATSAPPLQFKLAGPVVFFPQRFQATDFLNVGTCAPTEEGKGKGELTWVLLNHPMCEEGEEAKASKCGINIRRDFIGLHCDDYVGHDPKALCFNSFPPTYFALGDNAEVADELLNTPGFGIDDSGSTDYLNTTLAKMRNVSPVHVDADGHCLTHSISRCLIGKEYLWHALRYQLWLTMDKEKDRYLDWFKKSQFLTALDDEMDTIVKRCHPDYLGEEGSVLSIGRGLGTEHIFVLANVLKRPILLLDVQGSQHSEGFLFLPLLVDPSKVVTKKLIVVAWNNVAHQHYVPVVPIDSSQVAAIPDSELPRSHEETAVKEANEKGEGEGKETAQEAEAPPTEREYLVYGCPDDVKPSTLVAQYVEFQDLPEKEVAGGQTEKAADPTAGGSTEEEGADIKKKTATKLVRCAIIGGETILDTRAWAQGICDIYMEKHNVSIWAMHEVCRYLLKAGLKHSHELACIKDIHIFDKLCVNIAKSKKLFYCPVCTGTTDAARCCDPRRPCHPINVLTGRFDYQSADRLPLESTPGFSCCVYKHWCEVKTVKVGDPLFARDVGSAFQLGYLERMHETGEFDIRFRSGSSSSIRYCCPQDDIMLGFPTDSVSYEHHFSAAGYSCDALVVWDANDRLRLQVDKVTNDVTKKIMKQLPQKFQIAENYAKILQLVQKDVEYTKMKLESSCKIKAQVRNRMAARNNGSGGLLAGSSGFSNQSGGRLARGTAREKRYKDDQGNTMMWQSLDPVSREWIDYDHESTGVLEGAYQDGGLSQEIDIQGYGVFTIHFRSWFQENSYGYGRQVRRVALKEWNCPNCTYENPGTRENCELCLMQMITTPRPNEAFEVVGDKAIQADLDQLADMGDDDDDEIEDDAEVDRRYTELEAHCEKDDRLKAGNEYGDLFRDACAKANCYLVHHREDYLGPPKVYFIFWEADQRWIPIPSRLHPGHRLYDFVKSGTSRHLKAQGLTIYGKCALKYYGDTGSSDCVLVQISSY